MYKLKNLLGVFISLIALMLIGCGDLGFNKDVDNDDSLEESDDVQAAYKTIQGVYRGTINVVEDGKPVDLPIRITMYTEISFAGRANGELVPQTDLVANFEFLSIATGWNNFKYKGRYYYRRQGRIQLAVGRTLNAQNTGPNAMSDTSGVWFEAWMRGSQITNGTLYVDGEYGSFEATRLTSDIQVPAKGRLEEERKRLEEVFADVIGTYSGDLTKTPERARQEPGRGATAPLRFTFYLNEDGVLEAVLASQSTASESVRVLRVNQFRIDTGFIELEGIPELSGTGNQSFRGFGRFFARGTLVGDTLVLEDAIDHKGPYGDFCGKKNATKCN